MTTSIWDEIKDLFKTDKQLEEERQRKINDALNAENSVVDKLKELEKQYNDSLPKEEAPDLDALFPKDSGLKEIEYTPRSDEDIVSAAMKENAYDKGVKKSQIEDKYAKAIGALEDDKKSAKQNLTESYANLEKLYSQLRENSLNDSIKRGMARSSVAGDKLSALDSAHVGAAGDIERGYAESVAKIDEDISALEKELGGALDQLDVKSASELEDRIQKLKDERDAKVKEYEKYNNEVRVKNDKYALERENKIADYLAQKEKEKAEKDKAQQAYEKENGYSGEKLDNYSKRYQLAYDFYSSLSPDVAVDALKASPNMKYYLGVYYDKLMSSLKTRDNTSRRYF